MPMKVQSALCAETLSLFEVMRAGEQGRRVQFRASGADEMDGMSDQPNFAETLAGAQNGEEWAVSVLWRVHHPMVLRFLRVRHAQHDVEDVASEVWVRVSRSLGCFQGTEAQFRAWLFSLARATSVDSYRRAGRRREQLSADLEAVGIASGDDPEQAVVATMATEAAVRMLAMLPVDQAEVIALRVIAGLDTERVAEIVGKRPGTLRVLQHRGLQRLARLLEQDGVRAPGVTQ
jgi:RNA polymerase sigma-70 factor (ECF subfamily)